MGCRPVVAWTVGGIVCQRAMSFYMHLLHGVEEGAVFGPVLNGDVELTV